MKQTYRYQILIVMLLLMQMTTIGAQSFRKVTPARQQSMVNAISKQALSIKTLRCQFVQKTEASYMEEPVVANGYMDYDSKGNLTWKYIRPYRYTFTLSNNKATIQSDGKNQTIDLSGASVQSIVKMVKNSMTGQNLRSNRDFAVVMYDGGNIWKAELSPKEPRLKKFFHSISLYFDRRTKMVSKVIMSQPGDDKITIELSEIKTT